MRKGFLTQSKKDTTRLGPLRDERSTHSGATGGWGVPDMGLDSDPWVNRFQEVVLGHQFGGFNDIGVPSSNHVDENPYKNVPNLPYKTSGEPINALGCYYSQNYHTLHLKMSDYYFTWNDENPKSHLLLWTSIFICPLSGEIFVSGRWPGQDVVLKEATSVSSTVSDRTTQVDDETSTSHTESVMATPIPAKLNNLQVRWLKKKKIAEHGAAAWAYDCFQYRHSKSAIVHRTLDTKSTVLLPKRDVFVTSSIGSESPYLEDMAIRAIPEYVPIVIRRQIEERMVQICNDHLKYGEKDTNDTDDELAWCSPKNSQHHIQSNT
jgi:hypothetical protein